MLTFTRRLVLPLLVLLLAAASVFAEEPNRNVRFGLPSPAKVGDKTEKRAYLVGKPSDGTWAGLKITVVETSGSAARVPAFLVGRADGRSGGGGQLLPDAFVQ